MDIVLHKKLLALQEENAILRKQIEDLQELSDKTIDDYIRKASIDAYVLGKHAGLSTGYEAMSRPDDTEGRESFKKTGEKFDKKANKRITGIWRAMRLRDRKRLESENKKES